MTSGVRPMTVRWICSICAAEKPRDSEGHARPRLNKSRKGRSRDATRKGRLPKAALPGHECSLGEVMCPLFQSRYRDAHTSEGLAHVFEARAAQGRVSSALSEKGADPGEYDDALLQSRELVGGEGRVGRHVCPCHRGQVGRGFHASFCSATSDDSSIAWAQANSNAVSRPHAFRGRVVCRGSLRPAVFIHKCPNRHQRKSRLGYAGRVGQGCEAGLLRRRGAGTNRQRCCPGGAAAHIDSGCRPELRPQLCARCPRGAGGKGRGRAPWRFLHDRVEARAGLTLVVDRVMSSVIAAAEMNRRQPMTTLASSPEGSDG